MNSDLVAAHVMVSRKKFSGRAYLFFVLQLLLVESGYSADVRTFFLFLARYLILVEKCVLCGRENFFMLFPDFSGKMGALRA